MCPAPSDTKSRSRRSGPQVYGCDIAFLDTAQMPSELYPLPMKEGSQNLPPTTYAKMSEEDLLFAEPRIQAS